MKWILHHAVVVVLCLALCNAQDLLVNDTDILLLTEVSTPFPFDSEDFIDAVASLTAWPPDRLEVDWQRVVNATSSCSSESSSATGSATASATTSSEEDSTPMAVAFVGLVVLAEDEEQPQPPTDSWMLVGQLRAAVAHHTVFGTAGYELLSMTTVANSPGSDSCDEAPASSSYQNPEHYWVVVGGIVGGLALLGLVLLSFFVLRPQPSYRRYDGG
eukprot:TRINITY_DN10161_c0_g1_i2.p1 TRINITY_DN10161_c0_g1~~TRINITY_DN10161_c0_g1_i2.p1  ORF type:complete len:216 (+),score=61.84 TRINITY_DN10161_c0_g1_i2:216-863(+)